MFIRRLFLALLCCSITITPAWGWSEESHMTTGAIAYEELAAHDPLVLAEIERILSAHPHFARLEAKAKGQVGAERMRTMFEWLARWPDDINGTEFEHRDWHYELRVVYGRVWLWPFRNGNASYAFDLNYRTLADRNAPARERAIAIGWLLHIIGDIQQPLHAGHQMTSAFWLTDEAGSLAYVRKEAGGTPTDMHQYWDKILDVPNADGTVGGDATARYWTQRLMALWPRERIRRLAYPGTAQEQFSQWLDGSMHLAQLVGYTGSYLKASPDPAGASVVSEEELRVAKEVAKRRVATGGYRIADVLRTALAPPTPNSTS